MKKHFNEDLYYPIVTLLMGVVRLLPDSGTWWWVVELVVDLALLLMVGLSLFLLLKKREEPFHTKPAAFVLISLALLDYSVFTVLQIAGVETENWNTVGAIAGLVLGAISLVLTIIYLAQKKSGQSK